MALINLTPETMAAFHPDLFCVNRLPIATFAQQYATAMAVVRQPMPPAACQLLAELEAVVLARRVA